jgi:hypothetical protein
MLNTSVYRALSTSPMLIPKLTERNAWPALVAVLSDPNSGIGNP